MKCTPSEIADRCRACLKQDKHCTFTYVHKKPGRPLGSTKKRTPLSSTRTSPAAPAGPSAPIAPAAVAPTGVSGVNVVPSIQPAAPVAGPTPASLFGSARLTCEDPSVPLGDLGLLDLIPPLPLHPPFDALGGPLPSPAGSGSPLTTSSGAHHSSLPSQIPSLTSILPWEDASFFLNLYLTHQHCLVPLIHKPSFAQSVLARRDKFSPVFRALLCAITAWTIAQCPISLMPGYSRSDLGRWVDRCLAHNDALRRERDASEPIIRPTSGLGSGTGADEANDEADVELLELLTASMLDWVTAQSLARPCDLLVSQITRYIDCLRLRSARSWPTPILTQLARRVFWIVYTKDKTDAMSGRALILNDFEGLPPLPDEVDDEYITPNGIVGQPEGKLSHMAGFRAICRIFQVLSQCITRHRAWANPVPGDARPESSTTPSTRPADISAEEPTGEDAELEAAERQAAADAHLAWIARAQARLRSILSNLPEELCVDLQDCPPSLPCPTSPSTSPSATEAEKIKYAIRQADVVITGLCAEFCLLDFRAAIVPALDTRKEREEVARKSYAVLESIPIEYLASNGECMRGKVLRIILTLLSMTTEPELFSQNVWDWWNMYSRVQFLQVIPEGMVPGM